MISAIDQVGATGWRRMARGGAGGQVTVYSRGPLSPELPATRTRAPRHIAGSIDVLADPSADPPTAEWKACNNVNVTPRLL